jgi:hypothetical protein
LDEGERTRLACRFQRPRWKHRGKVFDGASNTTAGAAVLPIPQSAIRFRIRNERDGKETLFPNSFWDGRLGQMAIECVM